MNIIFLTINYLCIFIRIWRILIKMQLIFTNLSKLNLFGICLCCVKIYEKLTSCGPYKAIMTGRGVRERKKVEKRCPIGFRYGVTIGVYAAYRTIFLINVYRNKHYFNRLYKTQIPFTHSLNDTFLIRKNMKTSDLKNLN